MKLGSNVLISSDLTEDSFESESKEVVDSIGFLDASFEAKGLLSFTNRVLRF